MAMERHFLGWDAPGLPMACDWLIGRYGVDLRGVIVVLPGGRAGRRLMELLVDAAASQDEGRGEPLVPPRITTVGGLADQVIDAERVADEASRQLAWTEALRGLAASERATLMPHAPRADDVPGWAALAGEVERLAVELIGEGVSFAEARRMLDEEMDAPGEAARWAVLEAVEARYVELMARVGLRDPYAARWAAVRGGEVKAGRDIVVIGAADLNRFQRELLDAAAGHGDVHVLVHAPESRADDFDAHGCVIVERWAEATLPLDDDEHLRVVQRPIDQAMQVVRDIEELGGEHPAEQITLGVCDAAVTPYLEQMLPGYGLRVRDAAGTAMDRTGPVRLLAAAADYVEQRRFADFAALLRHPDIAGWLLAHGGPGDAPLDEGAIDQWLGFMDRYYTDHLQQRLTGKWLGRPDRAAELKAVYDAVHHADMLGALLGAGDAEGADETRPLSGWAEAIAQVLIGVYGREPVDRTTEAGRAVIEVCDTVREVLSAYKRLPPGLDVKVSAAAALRLVVGRLTAGAIPPEADTAAIEMLGPLELPLDDAAVCIVTGFNEGKLPESTHGDALLPDGLRAKLGVFDNRRRYARDVYAVSSMLHSKRTLRLIAGRRDAAGDPLRPSRLMFAADPDTIARRIRRFYGEGDDVREHPPARLSRWKAGEASRFEIPPPLRVTEMPGHMRVTDFKAYLACRYRFAMSRLLGLKHVDDVAAEMDAMQFGIVAHDVLERFAHSDAAGVSDERVIARTLDELADAVVAERFGDEPLPAVIIQREQIKHRLRGFAAWQAERVSAGWRIVYAERKFQRETAGVLDLGEGATIALHGTIDRIDRHEASGAWAVLDYKTGDKGDEPDKTHRKGKQNAKEWVDLQLPLYRTLVRSLVDESGARVIDDAAIEALQLGYVVLPKDTRAAGARMAAWTPAELDDAEAEAARIVREIRTAIESGDPHAWGEPEDVNAMYDEFAWLCGVGQMTPPGEGDDERDGEGGDA